MVKNLKIYPKQGIFVVTWFMVTYGNSLEWALWFEIFETISVILLCNSHWEQGSLSYLMLMGSREQQSFELDIKEHVPVNL